MESSNEELQKNKKTKNKQKNYTAEEIKQDMDELARFLHSLYQKIKQSS